MILTEGVMSSRAAFALLGLVAVAAACGGGSSGPGTTSADPGGSPAQPATGYGTTSADPAGSPAPPAPPATLAIATDARLGNHLVDGSGRSLYYFGNDVPAGDAQPAVSNCGAGCLPIWPVFHTDRVVAQGIEAGDVGQITRSDGSSQSTYKGFPLYYYAGDTAAGDTNGEGVSGIWFVAHVPAYSVALLLRPTETARYLTDGAGHALYLFARDTVGGPATPPVSACTSDPCAATWRPFLTDEVTVPSALVASDFTVYTRPDGGRQSVYRGHPLYRYAGDAAPGETNGRAVPGWQTIDPAS